MPEYLRIWEERDLSEITAHLLILGDALGDCASCRCLGIDLSKKNCPECKTEFRYVTSRRIETHPGEAHRIVRRARQARPDLVFIDYTDFKSLTGRAKGRDFLSR